jgi:hypothetical protein
MPPAAADTGTAISVGLVIALWVVALAVILGASYGVYKLARRAS